MGDTMFMPKTWEEFLKDYEFKDHKELYTNGSMMIQSFRVKQMMEHYARPKRGRWDASGRYRFKDGSIAIRCTECGAALHSDEWQKYVWNYCPNCGADMRGDSDE